MRQGTIMRPPSATEPIIRVTGEPEHPIIEDAIIEIPDVPLDWTQIAHYMAIEAIEAEEKRK